MNNNKYIVLDGEIFCRGTYLRVFKFRDQITESSIRNLFFKAFEEDPETNQLKWISVLSVKPISVLYKVNAFSMEVRLEYTEEDFIEAFDSIFHMDFFKFSREVSDPIKYLFTMSNGAVKEETLSLEFSFSHTEGVIS